MFYTQIFSGGQYAINAHGVADRIRAVNAASDARMNSSLAVEKNRSSESMAYRDVSN